MAVLDATAAAQWPVFVSNVSSTAVDSTLREFFSFCGPVGGIKLVPAADGATQEATVEFLTEAGAETALVLDLALIGDRSIHVRKAVQHTAPAPAIYTPAGSDQPLHEPLDHTLERLSDASAGDTSSFKPQPPPVAPSDLEDDPSTSAASTAPASEAASKQAEYQYPRLMALVSAGYRLGQKARDKLATIEAEHQYKRRAGEVIHQGLARVQARVRQVDEQHAISAKVKAFNDEHEITERVSAAWKGAVDGGKAAVENAKPRIQSAVDTAKPKIQAAVDSARPHIDMVNQNIHAAVQTARPHLSSAAEVVATSAGNLKQKAKDRLEQPDVQRGLDSARQTLADLGSWASVKWGHMGRT